MEELDDTRRSCELRPTTINNTYLPASRRSGRRHAIVLPSSDINSFLQDLHDDLSVERIDDIERHLWLVGRPYPPRPLNTQRVLEREIILTDDASLHLVWTTGRIYVRPLPSFLVDETFYPKYLTPANLSDRCRPALGLLYSYFALIPAKLDFEIAKKNGLVPEAYKWDDWKTLVHRALKDYNQGEILTQIPHRYKYGELRLDRLDKIYRCLRGDILHGFSRLTGSTRYVDWFPKNIAVVGASTVYLIVILSAMSVGHNTDSLKDNKTWDKACYGFVMFAIFLPLIGIALVSAVLVFMIVANYIKTMDTQEQMENGHGQRREADIESKAEGMEMGNIAR